MSSLARVATRPTWLLGRVHARAQALLADVFAAEQMRGYHYRVLAALDQYGPGSQADVGREAGIDRSDIVATVNDLLSRGYVRRAPDRTDRRRNVVTITRSGRAALERLDVGVGRVQDEILGVLSATDRAALLRLLERIA